MGKDYNYVIAYQHKEDIVVAEALKEMVKQRPNYR